MYISFGKVFDPTPGKSHNVIRLLFGYSYGVGVLVHSKVSTSAAPSASSSNPRITFINEDLPLLTSPVTPIAILVFSH